MLRPWHVDTQLAGASGAGRAVWACVFSWACIADVRGDSGPWAPWLSTLRVSGRAWLLGGVGR